MKKKTVLDLRSQKSTVKPTAIPARTSVGKCTNRYSLENAIRQARISAAAPSFLCITKIETAAANEAAEWPDGKE